MKPDRKLKRAFRTLGKLQKNMREQETEVKKSLMMPPQRRRLSKPEIPNPMSLIRQGFTVEELKVLFNEGIEEYKKLKEEYEKRQAKAKARAEKNVAEQRSPWNQFGIGGIYGVYGTIYGSSGYSKTGEDIGEKLKELPKRKLRGILSRLDNGEVPRALASYNKEYVAKCRDWLLSVIRSKA